MDAWYKALVVLMMSTFVLGICLRIFLIKENFPVVDEVAHLPAGVSHLQFGRFDLYRVNPPLVRMIAAFGTFESDRAFDWRYYRDDVGARPEFEIGVARLEELRLAYQAAFVIPRICVCSIYLILLVVFYRLVCQVNPRVACLVIAFFAVCPNQIAYSALITPDAVACVMGAIACLSVSRGSLMPTFYTALDAGIALGLALLCKLTLITFFVSLPLISFWMNIREGRPIGNLRLSFYYAGVFFIALVCLNAGYFFEEPFLRLKGMTIASESFQSLQSTLLGSIPLPLPKNYVLGIDYLRFEVEEKKWSFLMQEWRKGSWSHYYMLTTLFKTPEPLLIAASIGFGTLLVGIRRKMVDSIVVSMFASLAVPALFCFFSVSFQGGFNHHHRYVLMIYPVLFFLAGYMVSPASVQILSFRATVFSTKRHSLAYPLAFICLLLCTCSTLRVHPFYTSYFNSFSGGPENGWRLLGFSNIDWGQDLLHVDDWIKRHPECRVLAFDLDYFGLGGEIFGLPNISPPELPKGATLDAFRSKLSETQWWVVNVRSLYNLPGHSGLEYLQTIEPVDKIAYSYFVFRIDPLKLK